MGNGLAPAGIRRWFSKIAARPWDTVECRVSRAFNRFFRIADKAFATDISSFSRLRPPAES